MEQLSAVLCLVLLLCAVSSHGVRLLHEVDGEYCREFDFGTKAAAGADAEPLDASVDDYDNEISRVEFEPEHGTVYAGAAAPTPAAAGPAPEPVTARSAAAAAVGRGSMKWWLPPSTMPSFPLFPNPGGMPGMPMPGIGMPLPTMQGMPMPFHPIGNPIGWGAAPAPPGQAQPTPPAAANDSPNPNEVIN